MRHGMDTRTVRAEFKLVSISFVNCNISASAPHQNALIVTLTSEPFAFRGFLNANTVVNNRTKVNSWTVDGMFGVCTYMLRKEQQQQAKDDQINALGVLHSG